MERSRKKMLEEAEKQNANNNANIIMDSIELKILGLKIEALNKFKEENLISDIREPNVLYFDNDESEHGNLKDYLKSDEFENKIKKLVVETANSLETLYPEAISQRHDNYSLVEYNIIEEKDLKTHEFTKEDINSALIAEIFKNIKKLKEDINSIIKNNVDEENVILKKDWDNLTKKYTNKSIKLNYSIEREKKEKTYFEKHIKDLKEDINYEKRR